MFFCAGNVQQHAGTPYFNKITGLIKTRTWTAVLFLMATFAITGVPPFGLFQSEFTALSGAFAAGRIWAGALFILGVVTIFAGFLVRMTGLCLGSPKDGCTGKTKSECPWKMSAMLMIAAATGLCGIGRSSPNL